MPLFFSPGRRRLTLCFSQVLIYPPTGSVQADLVFLAGTDFPAHWVGAGRPCALRRCGFNRQIFPLCFLFTTPIFRGSTQANLVPFEGAVLTAGFLSVVAVLTATANR
jgi:hypothetical protein